MVKIRVTRAVEILNALIEIGLIEVGISPDGQIEVEFADEEPISTPEDE